MSKIGHCSSCLKSGPSGRTRDFLCGECVSPNHVSTFCRMCGVRSRKTAEEASNDLSMIQFGFTIENGTVLVFDSCGVCNPHLTGKCEVYAIG